jgi:hypothetical protein
MNEGPTSLTICWFVIRLPNINNIILKKNKVNKFHENNINQIIINKHYQISRNIFPLFPNNLKAKNSNFLTRCMSELSIKSLQEYEVINAHDISVSVPSIKPHLIEVKIIMIY